MGKFLIAALAVFGCAGLAATVKSTPSASSPEASAEKGFKLANAGDILTVSCGGELFSLRPSSARLWLTIPRRVTPLFSSTLQVQGDDGPVYVGTDGREVAFVANLSTDEVKVRIASPAKGAVWRELLNGRDVSGVTVMGTRDLLLLEAVR